ncbi:MAG: DUF4197 domain-containing protein [Sideroxydans sp.]|jgi:hypothetical protein
MRKLKNTAGIVMMACSLQAGAFDLGGLINQKLGQQTTAAPVATPAASAPPMATAPATPAVDLSMFTNKDQVGSLKQALTQGAQTAVKSLAKTDGFLGNEKVRIPLPDNLKKVDATMRQFGMGKYADELNTTMNRAAEAAVPEAQALLVGAISKMSVKDATDILTGKEDAATQYFRTSTEAALASKFQPIVAKSMQKVKLSDKYNQFASKGAQFGLVDPKNANLNDYITRKTMDGLFLMMAEQEKNIRSNPAQATGDLAKKVFSALKL